MWRGAGGLMSLVLNLVMPTYLLSHAEHNSIANNLTIQGKLGIAGPPDPQEILNPVSQKKPQK